MAAASALASASDPFYPALAPGPPTTSQFPSPGCAAPPSLLPPSPPSLSFSHSLPPSSPPVSRPPPTPYHHSTTRPRLTFPHPYRDPHHQDPSITPLWKVITIPTPHPNASCSLSHPSAKIPPEAPPPPPFVVTNCWGNPANGDHGHGYGMTTMTAAFVQPPPPMDGYDGVEDYDSDDEDGGDDNAGRDSGARNEDYMG
ncbi:hypothetical protein B0F90DRAFT_1769430 [Multifurca ochricompacta]|uniref:Uncharacterized protein n=1 Tax=Multifurca ochricompacta TaxID=376703 RepID=A0AAD4LXR8_9AGAM|nr:hypothetical protein B0F90DRAFT_1769430 [Multifurca ochricompacta]